MSIPESWTAENWPSCPQCGSAVPMDAKQCEECGYVAELEAEYEAEA